jgi:hypothetical protein
MKVYESINKITAALAKEGIPKDSKNQQQGWSFRGIDALMNKLASLLSEHGLCILPRVVDRELVERTSKNGSVLFFTTLTVEFDFVSAEDASKHTVVTVGEAMDNGDKSANKAMSAAYKYACFEAFCIPTAGMEDPDSHVHEIVDTSQQAKPKEEPKKPKKEPEKAPKPETQPLDEAIVLDMLAAVNSSVDAESLEGVYKVASATCNEAHDGDAKKRLNAAVKAKMKSFPAKES